MNDEVIARLEAQLGASGRLAGNHPSACLVVGEASATAESLLAAAGLPSALATLEPRELDAIASEMWQLIAGGVRNEVGAIDSMTDAWTWVDTLVSHLIDDGDLRGSVTRARDTNHVHRIFVLVTPRRTVVIALFGDD